MARAKCTIGLVKRLARVFECPYVTKSLYTSLVRPILEYASVAWSPNLSCDVTRIESIQKQFLIFALRGFNWAPGFVLPHYEARLTLLDLDSLSDRRTVATRTFTVSCLLGLTSPTYLQRSLLFKTPTRTTRSSVVLSLEHLPTPRPQYVANSPLRRCIATFNQHATLFSSTQGVAHFREAITQYLHGLRRTRILSAR